MQPSKWTKAAQRAISADLVMHCRHGRSGTVTVPSETNIHERYVVQLVDGKVGRCSCTAGANDIPCKHRAAVAIRLYERETGVRVTWVRQSAGIERFLD